MSAIHLYIRPEGMGVGSGGDGGDNPYQGF